MTDLQAAVDAALALHHPYRFAYGEDRHIETACAECTQEEYYAVDWPCLTVRLLQGEEPKPHEQHRLQPDDGSNVTT